MKKTINLYTTAGCHLCEQAESMFQYLQQNKCWVEDNYSLFAVDIANDEELIERFGIRIPVLIEGGRELGWPFEVEELENWLGSRQ